MDSPQHAPTAAPDLARLAAAIDFAARRHTEQRRKNAAQSPFINHPIAVMRAVAEEGGVTDVEVLMAAVLHDTVEDTATTPAELEAAFGQRVRALVAECTDDKSLPRAERKRLQVEHAPHISKDGQVVKLADKLSNLRDLERELPVGWEPERAAQYFLWARDVVAGLRGANPALEALLDAVFARNIKA